VAITDRTDTVTDALRERAGDARDVLGERWHDFEERIPGDLETALRRGRIAAWELVRVAGMLLVAGPRAVVTALGTAGRVTDALAERGARASEGARSLAAAVPPPRAVRRRATLRTFLWTSAGFGAGFAVGWLLARRPAVDQHEGWEPVVAAAAGEVDLTVAEAVPPAAVADPAGPHA